MSEKKGCFEIWLIAALAVGVAIGVSLGLFVFPFLRPLLAVEGAAAWVQSIGSVLAILSAVYISYYESKKSKELRVEQWRKEESDEKANRKKRLRSIVRVVERCGKSVIWACGAVTSPTTDFVRLLRFQRLRLVAVLSWLDLLPISNEPGVLVAGDVVNLKLKITLVIDILDNLEPIPLGQSGPAELDETVAWVSNLLEELADYADHYKGDYDELRVPDL
ncbi:hypothetical protein N879_04435 [Alcaligenes sp. EGD-AK7]|uniref:hypothetical protein n=1 Tax=Alcaligenes sp. EGD-AK7 TaxID=1386079 RepID=UPI0002AA6653|nr:MULTISPECIES: hypothetical protein [unclassified Alcaligenes]EKU29842.1 hypothetical protein C660_11612 [Alcaligenes sp. HPC1271]ERI34778.1 hypothetical protein N879_04435 [Alcaligenes sp. EGD-AK7]